MQLQSVNLGYEQTIFRSFYDTKTSEALLHQILPAPAGIMNVV
ncbi:MAG TPA: hypothetical protein VHO69_03975 [Phototrophicaceae bacterium]|nr:hypothetical protein [Phototrophicaceae bacterium]